MRVIYIQRYYQSNVLGVFCVDLGLVFTRPQFHYRKQNFDNCMFNLQFISANTANFSFWCDLRPFSCHSKDLSLELSWSSHFCWCNYMYKSNLPYHKIRCCRGCQYVYRCCSAGYSHHLPYNAAIRELTFMYELHKQAKSVLIVCNQALIVDWQMC